MNELITEMMLKDIQAAKETVKKVKALNEEHSPFDVTLLNTGNLLLDLSKDVDGIAVAIHINTEYLTQLSAFRGDQCITMTEVQYASLKDAKSHALVAVAAIAGLK